MRKILFLALPLLLLFSDLALAETETLSIMGNLMGATVVVTTTDSSELLSTVVTAALTTAGSTANWKMVRSVLITAETNPARIAFGRAASTTVGHVLAAGSSLRIPSGNLANAARIISAGSSTASTLQVTLEF